VASKQTSGATVQVDLVKLAKFLPTHLLAAVCKPDSKYWIDGHISRGMKSLLHLTRLGKKKTGPIEQEISNNLKKYVDLCFFTTVRFDLTLLSDVYPKTRLNAFLMRFDHRHPILA
jgi:hypothetical protein